MSIRKYKKYQSASIFSWLLIFILFTTTMVLAGETYSNPDNKLKIKKQTISNLTLTKFVENQALINGSPYIFTSNTKFTKKNKRGQITSVKINEIDKIMLPCLVDITYRTYSVYTESFPFYPEDRVLTSLFVKKQRVN